MENANFTGDAVYPDVGSVTTYVHTPQASDDVAADFVLNAYLSFPPVSLTRGVDPYQKELEMVRCRGLDHMIDFRVGEYRKCDIEQVASADPPNTAQKTGLDSSGQIMIDVVRSCEMCGTSRIGVYCVFLKLLGGGIRRFVCGRTCAQACYRHCLEILKIKERQDAGKDKCILCTELIEPHRFFKLPHGPSVHLLCAMFSPGVSIDPFFSVYGVPEMIKKYKDRKCDTCRCPGASIECLICSKIHHFKCLGTKALIDARKRTVMCCTHTFAVSRKYLEERVPKNTKLFVEELEPPLKCARTDHVYSPISSVVEVMVRTNWMKPPPVQCDGELKIRFRLMKSFVHGVGVFALEPIDEDAILFEADDRVLPRNRGQRNVQPIHYKFLAPPGTFTTTPITEIGIKPSESQWISYVNHSCSPNAHFVAFENERGQLECYVSASRRIFEGEEVYVNYLTNKSPSHFVHCKCKSSICKGWIF
ncbi:hypothetical protein ACOME3_008985 [Neoechinorhynchus agilis]